MYAKSLKKNYSKLTFDALLSSYSNFIGPFFCNLDPFGPGENFPPINYTDPYSKPLQKRM